MSEALTLPSAFPPCGHDVNKDLGPTRRTYRLKTSPFVPALRECRFRDDERQSQDELPAAEDTVMDVGIVAAVALLVLWGLATLFLGAPGWANMLLTVGVFLLVWRVVRSPSSKAPPRS